LLRTLVLLLVLANLAFLAWTQGLLSPLAHPPMSSEREPERLTRQVQPDAVKVLGTQAAAKLEREQAQASAAQSAAPAASAASQPAAAGTAR
jgi:hypothetical protein